MNPILEVRHLKKQFAEITAVDDISFQIQPGTCFGLLGPNGAGKTTTIEMIEGLTEPTGGEILYQGKPRDQRFKMEAGIQFQSTSVMDKLAVIEILKLFYSLYSKRTDLDALIQTCGLESLLPQRATKLSGGQKQRLMFALALINDPQIVFLDEPTTGLDPQSRRNLWDMIERIKAQGKTVLLTTHYMDEAEILCDTLVIVDQGKIIAQGTPKELLKQHFDHFYVSLDRADFESHLPHWPEAVNESHDVIEIQSQSVEVTLQQLQQHQVNLRSLRVRNPTLEDLFLKLTGHSLRE